MQGKALPGFRDFYPEELALRNHIFAVWRRVAVRYGFEEYDGPPLEALDLYTQKSGEEIVQQLYAFRDKGDRDVALRPEMTPTLARLVAARAQALKKPIRWFSIPQLFRYERQQRGRLREHFQLNMDIIGEAGPLADAELIAAAIDILRAFGLGPQDVQARISDRRVLKALLLGGGVKEAQLPTAFACGLADQRARSGQNRLDDGGAIVRGKTQRNEVADARKIRALLGGIAQSAGECGGELCRLGRDPVMRTVLANDPARQQTFGGKRLKFMLPAFIPTQRRQRHRIRLPRCGRRGSLLTCPTTI